jgi:hypothetical protein
MSMDLKDIANELISTKRCDQSLTENLLFNITDTSKFNVESLFWHSVLEKYKEVVSYKLVPHVSYLCRELHG